MNEIYRNSMSRDTLLLWKKRKQPELFEDISCIIAKHADPQGVSNTPDEWLDRF